MAFIVAQHLQTHPEEVDMLFNDLLIGVTSFFRDARAYETLKRELGVYISKKTDETLRIWCVA